MSGLGGAFNAAKAASAHNEALDKLMQQKVKIANEKFDSISRVQKLAERTRCFFIQSAFQRLGSGIQGERFGSQ